MTIDETSKATRELLEPQFQSLQTSIHALQLPAPNAEDVHQFFNSVATGQSAKRTKSIAQWLKANWPSLLGWVVAAIALAAVMISVRTAPPPIVIEKSRIPQVIAFRQQGNAHVAWEGDGPPDSKDGRWVQVEFKPIK